jgi:hypothetical protein
MYLAELVAIAAWLASFIYFDEGQIAAKSSGAVVGAVPIQLMLAAGIFVYELRSGTRWWCYGTYFYRTSTHA